MGRLKRIELENFKSYFGHQIIGPFDDFTAIIGPNGSGKSNMMDAISFVLGVQSRHLRSSHLKELIFRKDTNSLPARRAFVKLVYEVSNDELEGYSVGREIHFSRNISSTGVSTYRLDEKEVTYEVYETLLQKIGVLVKARNFLVFQGDVESVASKSPAELTKLLEQICGSDQLQSEYDELLRKKKESDDNILFVIQKKKIYTTQRKEIKEQRDEAEAYKIKKQELEALRTEHILRHIFRLKLGIDDQQVKVEELRNQIEQYKENEQQIEDEIIDKKSDLAKLNKLQSQLEHEHIIHEKNLNKINLKLNEIKEKKKSLNKRVEELSNQIVKSEMEKNERDENLKTLQQEIKSLEDIESELDMQLQSSTLDPTVSLSAENLTEYSRLRTEVASRTITEHTEASTIETTIKSHKTRIDNLQQQIDSLQVELQSSAVLQSEYQERIQKFTITLSNNKKQIQEMEAQKELHIQEIMTSDQEIKSIQEELLLMNEYLRNAGEDKLRNDHEEKLNDAIETMKRIFPGVHGKLIDCCKPIQKRYSQAITVAMGQNMDAVVVDSRQVATECIRYLKDQRVGVCTFLPLDNISVSAPSERLRNLGAKYKLCMDLIEAEEIIKPAVVYAVGSTVVCDSLEDAQDLCFQRNERVKAVTLNGQVISRSGAMTGGSVGNQRGDRWEEKELVKMRKKKGDLEAELVELQRTAPPKQQLQELVSALKALEDQTRYCTGDKKLAEEKLAQGRQQTDLRTKRLRCLEQELEELKAEENALSNRLETLQEAIIRVENQVFKAFSKAVGVTNIREYEIKRLKAHEELITKKTANSERKAAATAQLEYQLQRDVGNVLKRLLQHRETARGQLEELSGQEAELLVEAEAVKKKSNAVGADGVDKMKQLAADKSSVASEVRELQSKRSKTSSERESAARRLAGEEILAEKSRAELHEVLEKAQVDEVALPTVPVIPSSATTSSQPPSQKHRKGKVSPQDSESSGSAGAGRMTDDSEISADDRLILWQGARTNKDGGSSGLERVGGVEDGSLEDTSGSGSGKGSKATATTGTTMSAHFSQSENQIVLRDQREMAKVDLSSLQRYRNLPISQLQQTEQDLAKQISLHIMELECINPNMHAMERYENVLEKLRECETELAAVRELARDITIRFDEVKTDRMSRFQECYRHVSEALTVIYKDLTRSSKHPLGGNAYLTLDNTEEPYLGGIRYTAMPPMKRFRNMDQLSGGEKTVAALALLFSIHSFRQAPFFVLDEVDAALDNVNVKKVCNYIRQRSKDFQCVVISLKDMFFEHADALVGVYKDVNSLSSRVLTLKLNDYDGPQGVGSTKTTKGGKKSILADVDLLMDAVPVPASPSVRIDGGTDMLSSPATSSRPSASTRGTGKSRESLLVGSDPIKVPSGRERSRRGVDADAVDRYLGEATRTKLMIQEEEGEEEGGGDDGDSDSGDGQELVAAGRKRKSRGRGRGGARGGGRGRRPSSSSRSGRDRRPSVITEVDEESDGDDDNGDKMG